MKKFVLLIALFTSLVFAQSAKMVEIISENTVKIDKDGVEKKIHLSGIELFAKANNSKETIQLVDYNKRDELKREALSYMKKMFPEGVDLSYQIFSKDEHGLEYVWISNNDFNYKIVRDGYALTDVEDPSLPTGLKNRMLIAQNYAKENGIGLWGKYKEMKALENQDIESCGCGFTQKKDVASDILKQQQRGL
ncbi:hypothetical protein CVO_09055 [Sulfurimonas sp. CVO]|jgi:endonuclease YncB( thermonuclease family)|uniref:thermonuclease family protein n=1 Tax=Sulfurimonas sp. CVO TaxID=2283483 RepID=UPI00132ECA61|nr:thermonuclease family protein [Sulfurimonas sp. CVO]QHG91958.1 hypothetical protein CVO_09055 [Sulfurimonas sp. CVO]